MASELLEVEIDNDKCQDMFFGPLGRRLRGGYDVRRAARLDKDAHSVGNVWPEPIPGQRLAVNPETKQGFVIEPLHDDRHAATREKITERKFARLEPHEQVFANIDVPTWLHHIKCAVEAGVAKVVAGKLPEKIEGNPRKYFHGSERKPTETATLTDAIREQTAAFTRLADLVERAFEGGLKAKR